MTSLAIYEILKRPIITEKSNFQHSELQQYAFEVDRAATKKQIKQAVETLFNVTVEKVNIINMPAKRARNLRTRRSTVRRLSYKKAILTLSPGDSIQVFEGVM